MRFMALYENERYWRGASEFYFALEKLGIDYRLYELPEYPKRIALNPEDPLPRHVMSSEEVYYWAESILNDLRGKPPSEYLDYVKERCLALKRWAEKGYLVHVI